MINSCLHEELSRDSVRESFEDGILVANLSSLIGSVLFGSRGEYVNTSH